MNKGTQSIFRSICKDTGASIPDGFKNPIKELESHIAMYVLYKGQPFECLIDKQDIKLIKNNKTWICKINGSGDKIYIICGTRHGHVLLHRLLTGCPDGMVVDHINGNTFDNRRSNIRVCTPGVNMLNKKKYNSNKTGVTGIIEHRGNYRLTIARQFNNLDFAIKAKQEIQHIIDYYSDMDAARRVGKT